MKAKDLKIKTGEELKKLLAEQREKLFALAIERTGRKLKDVSQIKKIRHSIARILTIMKEKSPESK